MMLGGFGRDMWPVASAAEARERQEVLRDQFAMAALPAIITATSAGQHDPRPVGSDMPLVEAMARDAYLLADAMLAARGGK